jgi:hypothetical protein
MHLADGIAYLTQCGSWPLLMLKLWMESVLSKPLLASYVFLYQ